MVIKVGTSSLLRTEAGTLHLSQICTLCETVARLNRAGVRVVLVSSGAVGAGMFRMGLSEKPKEVAKKQALAAVGQVHLMRYYEDIFNTIGVKCAQVLLTLENLSNRKQYVRARNTFNALFDMGVVPVVNENDCVAVEELRFGDNDTLSAQVAALCEAQWLFLLTDVDGEYSLFFLTVCPYKHFVLQGSTRPTRTRIRALNESRWWRTSTSWTWTWGARGAAWEPAGWSRSSPPRESRAPRGVRPSCA